MNKEELASLKARFRNMIFMAYIDAGLDIYVTIRGWDGLGFMYSILGLVMVGYAYMLIIKYRKAPHDDN